MYIKCETSTRKNPCTYAPGIKFFLLRDLPRVYVQVQGYDVNAQKKMLEQLLNFCSYNSQAFDVLIKVFLDILKKNINFEVKCPFKKVGINPIVKHFNV